MTICINALAGPAAWHCFHYGGKATPGKESVNAQGRCEACEIATPPYEEAPSFMRNDEE